MDRFVSDPPDLPDHRPVVARSRRTALRLRAKALLGFVMLAALILAGCGDDDSTVDPTPAAEATAATAPTGEDGAAGTEDDQNGEETVIEIVSIAEGFIPSAVTVPSGSTVRWVNTDSRTHTVTTTGDDGWESGGLNDGDEFAVTLDQPGTYDYICGIHPSMTGEIVVE